MKVWIKKYKKRIAVILLANSLLIVCIMEVIDKINSTVSKLSTAEYVALLGFIITLATSILVPLSFFIIGERHRNADKIDNKTQLNRMKQKDTEDRILNHLPVDLASSIIRYVYGNENDDEINKKTFIEYNGVFVNNNSTRERENITSSIDPNWNSSTHEVQILEYDPKQFLALITEISRSKDNMQKAYEIINTIFSFEQNIDYKNKYYFVKEVLQANQESKEMYLSKTINIYNGRFDENGKFK